MAGGLVYYNAVILKVTQFYKGNFGKDNYEMRKATRGGI